MSAIDEQRLFELKGIRALVDVARLAILHINASETETSAEVLLAAVDRLTDLIEPENNGLIDCLMSRELEGAA